MINFDEYTNENKIEHNSKWPYIHPVARSPIQNTYCRWFRIGKNIIKFNKQSTRY